MTFYPTLEGDARKAYEDSIGVIWAEAQRQLSLDEQALVLRDLLASEDLKLSTESWLIPIPTATGYSTWINATVDDTRFTAVYGFATTAQGYTSTGTVGNVAGSAGGALGQLTLLRITRGGKQLRIWQIEPYTKNTPFVGTNAMNIGGNTQVGIAPQPSYTFYADDPVTVFQNIPFKVEYFATASPWTAATPVLPLLGKIAEPEGKTINR